MNRQILLKKGYTVDLNKSESEAYSKKLKLNVDQYPKCHNPPQIDAYKTAIDIIVGKEILSKSFIPSYYFAPLFAP